MGCYSAFRCQCRKVCPFCTSNNHPIYTLLPITISVFRNIQITKIRELFLSPKYPTVQLARNILERDSFGQEVTEPQVVESLRDTIPDTQSLQALLFSDRMYVDPQMFDKWCCAFESGVLRGTRRCPPQPLEMTLSVWHEAHFRLAPSHSFHKLFFSLFVLFNTWYSLELWYILTTNFRHRVSASHVADRAANYKKMFKCVRKERATNAANAWSVRRAQNNLPDVNDDANHYSEAGGGVNFDELDMF
jgi:hypothetical protein